MSIYDPKSMKAEEFINDAEILETLEYAEKNKHNVELIDELLEKARERSDVRGTYTQRGVCSACVRYSREDRGDVCSRK